MAITYLHARPGLSWDAWIEAHAGRAERVYADLHHPESLARVSRFQGLHRVSEHFVGVLDPIRHPLGLVEALAEALRQVEGDAVILGPQYRGQPVGRQLLSAVLSVLRPDRILVPEGPADFDLWPIGPETVELPAAFPEIVQVAQRRARWLELIDTGEDHELPLDTLTVIGSRLGSGHRLPVAGLHGLAPGAQWVELCTGVALVVSREPVDDGAVGQILDHLGASRLNVVDPMAYSGLICSLTRASGEDFALGMIEEIDFRRGIVRVRAKAPAPAPVKFLKIGLFRIDSSGRELGPVTAWSV